MKHDESGFTLVELMMVLVLTTLLLGIGATALRHYWRVRALNGARDTVVTQMRFAQQRSFSESFPTVYGVRFQKGSGNWSLVRYNDTAGTCVVVSHMSFDGVVISSLPSDTDFPEGTPASLCRNASPGGSAANEVALFYPRGSASAGTVGIRSEHLDRTIKVGVNGTTGRVAAL